MALPVAQIMNQLQRGVREERIDVDDNDEEAMAILSTFLYCAFSNDP